MDCWRSTDKGQQTDAMPRILLVACGALAHEIIGILRLNPWNCFEETCLPAHWHKTPKKIPEAVRAKIHEHRSSYDRVFVCYGDCGTGGGLDQVLAEEGVERIAGPHCYSFFATGPTFDALAEEEPGSFYVSDFLVRHFDRLIITGCGLDRYPDMRDLLFSRYRRLVYLAQTEDAKLTELASKAATRLGLPLEKRRTGYGDLAASIAAAATSSPRAPLPGEFEGTAL